MIVLGPFPTAEEIANTTAARLGNVGNVTVSSPVAVGGDVQVIQGDAYESRDGRALSWRSDAWPALGGAVVRLTTISKYDGRTYLDTLCTAFTGTIVCDLSSAQTAIPVGGYRISITAAYPDGHLLTLVQAEMIVTPRAGGAA